MSYYFNKILKSKNFDEAIKQVTSGLRKEGFGVLTEIDVKETLKKKLDVDFKRYTILGACNPNSAYNILQKEDKIGVFLPCNVIVEEHENGDIEVVAVDPIASFAAVKNDTIGCNLIDIQQKLIRIIHNLD
ncbi:MAG: DUF302 domain-containing protein [Bacteroidetes bacterium]|nr:DUF302 domain-containing protein [Bacteroidota bacterium]MBL6943985.1 DUF302 domain-containing protein [Bacteroidales bacterium]